MFIIYLLFFSFILMTPSQAYLGPGLGLGAIMTALLFIILILLGFFGLIFYPIKILIQKFKKKEKKPDSK